MAQREAASSLFFLHTSASHSLNTTVSNAANGTLIQSESERDSSINMKEPTSGWGTSKAYTHQSLVYSAAYSFSSA